AVVLTCGSGSTGLGLVHVPSRQHPRSQDPPLPPRRRGGRWGGDHHRPRRQAGGSPRAAGDRPHRAQARSAPWPHLGGRRLRRAPPESPARRLRRRARRASTSPAMRLLLDSHVFLWWLQDSRRLGRAARRAIEAPTSSVFVSAASIWELAIKIGMGKLRFRRPADTTLDGAIGACGFLELPVTARQAIGVRGLPPPPAHPLA